MPLSCIRIGSFVLNICIGDIWLNGKRFHINVVIFGLVEKYQLLYKYSRNWEWTRIERPMGNCYSLVMI